MFTWVSLDRCKLIYEPWKRESVFTVFRKRFFFINPCFFLEINVLDFLRYCNACLVTEKTCFEKSVFE